MKFVSGTNSMRVAFYAPLKWPGHPVPSGDRLIARMFVAALTAAGHEVTVATRLRTWDGTGDTTRQARLATIGAACASRLIARWRRDPAAAPDLWFTYHLYHKAPDWTGPAVCAALGLPYVVAEASVAAKQREGRWRDGHAVAEAAIRGADAVLCLNPADLAGVASVRDPRTPPQRLAPFFDVSSFLVRAHDETVRNALVALDLPRDSPRLATVAMMRPGDKLVSYRALAASLARLAHRPWHLVVVGDGAARADVHAAFASFAPGRIRFAGSQPPAVVAALLLQSDLFVWPAVVEVIGMALLEAQACGVPVVAGRRPGVEAIVADRSSGILVPPGDIAAFAAAVDALIADPARRAAMARHARAHVRERHDLPAASAALDAILLQARRAHRERQHP